jgi:hypothetical protein
MSPVATSTLSSRIAEVVPSIVRRPRPSSPIRTPQVSSSSTSVVAFDRLPSFSFSRISRHVLRRPVSSIRGTAKSVSPAGACARTRKRSLIGAETNHLWPVSR